MERTSPGARTAFALNAALAWAGVILVLVLSALGQFTGGPEPLPNLYGHHPAGLAGAFSRVADTLSYFTTWSNIVVAVALTLLAAQPHVDTGWRRILRLDSLLMITVTAIVYAVLLSPLDPRIGWSKLTNPWQHIVVPAVTVVVWLIWGPRRWITGRTVLGAMIIPLVWVAWMLARGEVVDAYPYGFVDVISLGYGQVFITIGAILVFGLAVAAFYWGVERLLLAVARRRQLVSAGP